MRLRDAVADILDEGGQRRRAESAADAVVALLRGRAQDEIWWCEVGDDQITWCMGHHQDRPCGYYHLLRLL